MCDTASVLIQINGLCAAICTLPRKLRHTQILNIFFNTLVWGNQLNLPVCASASVCVTCFHFDFHQHLITLAPVAETMPC